MGFEGRNDQSRTPAELQCVLVTGGAGFIGSNFVLDWIAAGHGPVVNLERGILRI